MKFEEFENMHKDNPKFNHRKFKGYWKAMVDYYQNSKYKDLKNKNSSNKPVETIIKLPTEFIQLAIRDREGVFGGIRNINMKKSSSKLSFVPPNQDSLLGAKIGVQTIDDNPKLKDFVIKELSKRNNEYKDNKNYVKS